jgi:hypothetical protein
MYQQQITHIVIPTTLAAIYTDTNNEFVLETVHDLHNHITTKELVYDPHPHKLANTASMYHLIVAANGRRRIS